MKIIDSDNYKMSASPGINLLICQPGAEERSECTMQKAHRTHAAVIHPRGTARLSIYNPHCPAVISSLFTPPFTRQQRR